VSQHSQEKSFAGSPASQGAKRTLEPLTIVIFGASGDLTDRKLMPALYHLAEGGQLPEDYLIVGVARRDWSNEFLREQMYNAVREGVAPQPIDEDLWQDFAKRLFYVRGDAKDPDTFDRLNQALASIDEQFGGAPMTHNRIYYLATLPSLYPELIQSLGELEKSRKGQGWGRIIIEKPFGRDLDSAVELNNLVRRYFDESQVFRIDHYLGKETVQNILVFRFANGIFEPVWNRRYIDNIQITVSESIGVGHRGAYYEEAGAMRDMVQNHLLQLLALTAMEPPASFAADAVRSEKVKVLQSIPIAGPDKLVQQTVRAQYGPGVVDGEAVAGYLSEPNVSPNSRTETFAALKLDIDNWRWAGVPFFLQTGKRLQRRTSQITIFFKRPPYLPFQRTAVPDLKPNCLILHIQPEQGVTLSLGAKVPGPHIRIRNVDMEFMYERTFKERSPDAYEHLLLESMVGDATMFTRGDEVEAAWKLVTAIQNAREEKDAPMEMYRAGSSGPSAKNGLLGDAGRYGWGGEPGA